MAHFLNTENREQNARDAQGQHRAQQQDSRTTSSYATTRKVAAPRFLFPFSCVNRAEIFQMVELAPELANTSDFRIAIAVAQWNEIVTKTLLEGAVDELKRFGVPDDNITVIHCSGSFELPFVANQCAQSGRYDAIIALGALIRGETPHFDYIAGAVTSGIQQINLRSDIPCIFGILTTDTIDQALDRAGLKAGNKGRDVARAALEMASIARQLQNLHSQQS